MCLDQIFLALSRWKREHAKRNIKNYMFGHSRDLRAPNIGRARYTGPLDRGAIMKYLPFILPFIIFALSILGIIAIHVRG